MDITASIWNWLGTIRIDLLAQFLVVAFMCWTAWATSRAALAARDTAQATERIAAATVRQHRLITEPRLEARFFLPHDLNTPPNMLVINRGHVPMSGFTGFVSWKGCKLDCRVLDKEPNSVDSHGKSLWLIGKVQHLDSLRKQILKDGMNADTDGIVCVVMCTTQLVDAISNRENPKLFEKWVIGMRAWAAGDDAQLSRSYREIVEHTAKNGPFMLPMRRQS